MPNCFFEGSIAANTSLAVSQSPRLDDGIFTSSEEVLDDQNHLNSGNARQNNNGGGGDNNKSSASLDGDGDNDRASVMSWGDEIRPSSAQANPLNRMCTGALSRAEVRLNGTSGSAGSDSGGELIRRQSRDQF